MVTANKPQFREVVENKLVLNFHKGQTEAWKASSRIVAVFAGTQWGKTCFGPHWLFREVERNEYKGDYLAVTATFPLLNLKMLPEFRFVFEHLLRQGTYVDSHKVFESHEKIHGAPAYRVIFGSAKNPESIESATAVAAWLDEAGQKQFRRDSWDAILRRLSLSMGNILITTTLYCLGWLKLEIYDRRFDDPDITIIQSPSTVNPIFPIEEYYKQKERMPAWKFAMFYDGRYERPAGMIYDCFDETTCKIPRFTIPDNWLWYVGHDFGGSNPAACFFAQDPSTGFFYLSHTYKPGKPVSVADQVREFKRVTEGRTVVKRMGGAHHEVGWRDDYTSHGWPIMEPKDHLRSVEVGINRVYSLLKLNKVFVFDDQHDFLDEILSYSRVLDDNNEPTEDIDNKDAYHLMDGMRYILSDFTPETVHRSSEQMSFVFR